MTTRQTPRRATPPPDVDAEEEVDLGRYWSTIVARWWLPLLGLIGGAAVGYLLALGGGGVYVAKVTAYLGQPFSPTASQAIQSPNSSTRMTLSRVRCTTPSHNSRTGRSHPGTNGETT